MGLLGFEPRSPAPEAGMLNQVTPQPHCNFKNLEFKFLVGGSKWGCWESNPGLEVSSCKSKNLLHFIA